MTAPTLTASRKTKKTGIPIGWKSKLIREAGIVQGGRQRNSNNKNGNLHPYLRVANVFDGFICTKDVFQMHFTDDEFEIYRLLPNDILLNEGQSLELVGRSAVYKGEPRDCCFQNTLVRFRPNADTDTHFASYLFQHLLATRRFSAIASKTTSIAHLGVNRFAFMRAVFPPLPEQRRIAAVLGAWDRALRGLEKLLAAKQQFRQVLMQELLTGTKRFKQFSTDKWKVYCLSDLLERVFRPVTLSEDVPLDLISIRRRAGGLFFRGSFTAREFKTLDLNRIEAGDFLVSKRQVTHGALAMVRKDFEGMHVSNEYVIFRRKTTDTLHLPFFDWLSRSPRMWHMAYLASNGVHIEKLIFDADDFLKEKILLPPSLPEQQKIVEVLEASGAEIRILERQLALLRDQKRGLLQKLLTGKVRVKST